MDRLLVNQSLKVNQSLTSGDGRFTLVMQGDGNLVLYEGRRARWESRTTGRGAVTAVMQGDANFVLYDKANRPIWATDTDGGGGAFIVLQNDGNLVIYRGSRAIWDRSRTSGNLDANKSWLAKAVSTTLHAPSNLANAVAHEVEKAAPGIAKIVSSISHSPAWSLTPFGLANVVNDIAHGKRLDHVIVDDFKRQIAGVKAVAPYAQTVVSFVPGVGTGVSAAIAAGAALAQGKRIDAALMSAAKNALPGGPVAAAAFDTAVAAAQGKNVTASALEALQGQLPEGAKQAFATGVALAQGQNLQQAVLKGAALIPGVPGPVSKGLAAAASVGKIASLKDVLVGAARTALPDGAAKLGFDAANGVLLHGGKLDEVALALVRKNVAAATPAALKGFDSAIALHVGRYAQFKAPVAMKDPLQKSAFYIAQGLRGAPPKVTQRVHKAVVSKNPTAKLGFGVGVKAAAKEQGAEQSQVILTRMRETMRRVRRKHAPTVKQLATVLAQYKKGDPKAKATITMLAIADRANRELDGRRTPGAIVRVSGLPLLTFLSEGANYMAALALVPFDWIKQTFFVDKAA